MLLYLSCYQRLCCSKFSSDPSFSVHWPFSNKTQFVFKTCLIRRKGFEKKRRKKTLVSAFTSFGCPLHYNNFPPTFWIDTSKKLLEVSIPYLYQDARVFLIWKLRDILMCSYCLPYTIECHFTFLRRSILRGIQRCTKYAMVSWIFRRFLLDSETTVCATYYFIIHKYCRYSVRWAALRHINKVDKYRKASCKVELISRSYHFLYRNSSLEIVHIPLSCL